MHEGSSFSTSSSILVIICPLNYSHPSGYEWYLIVVLIFIFPMVNDVKHILMCWLAIHLSSWAKCLFKSGLFLIGLFILLLSFKSCLYILDTNSIPDIWCADIFSQSGACLFIFLMGKLFKLLESNFNFCIYIVGKLTIPIFRIVERVKRGNICEKYLAQSLEILGGLLNV